MAFGMGVDSLCVERVIHFGVSANYGNNNNKKKKKKKSVGL